MPHMSGSQVAEPGERVTGLADSGNLRWVAVELAWPLEEARRRLDLSPLAAVALGRALSAAALVQRILLKVPSRVILEARGDGPLGSVLGEVETSGALRGCVANPRLETPDDGGLRLADALGRGTLRVTREERGRSYSGEVELVTGGAYTSHNVIGEIRGSELPDEFVIIGAHLDSWDIGTGALDNGCNVALVIDVARQIKRLGLKPKRTIRFALWNGEEQGIFGSWAYNQTHKEELDGHVMASSFDTGSGRIRGFLTNGRLAEMAEVLDAALEPVAGLGPFTHTDVAIFGTDHFDFVLEGVAGLVADQESANYGPNYHARPDTFDKVDQEQLKLNSAIAAAVVWGYANAEIGWGRLDRAGVQEIIDAGLEEHMRAFRVMHYWEDGSRGRTE